MTKYDFDGREMVEVPVGIGTGAVISAGTQINSTGTCVFSNSNNFTFGMTNSSRVTGSWALDIRASGSTDSMSSISFQNSNGVTFGLSSGTITASVSPAASAGIAGLGFYTGVSPIQYTSGTVFISGDGEISLISSAGQLIHISAPIQSIETAQWRIDGTAGTIPGLGTASTVNVNSMRIRPVGGISAGFDLLDVIELSVLTQSAQTQNCVDVTIAGNSTSAGAGFALISSGTLTLAGGPNITLSQNGNAVSIMGGAGGGGGAGISGIQVSNTTLTSGTVTFQNANGISFGSSGANGISASYTVPTVTNSSWTVSDNATSMTVARLAFTQSNGLTLSLSTTTGGSATVVGSYTVPVVGNAIQDVGSATGSGTNTSKFAADDHVHRGLFQAQISGNTSNTSNAIYGSIVFAGGNNITLSQSTAAGAATITISAFNQTVQTQNCVDVTLAGNTTGTLALISSGTMTLAGGNNIVLSQNGNAVTISASNSPAQTNQTIGFYAVSNTASTSTSTTLDARTISFNGAGGNSVGFSNGSIIMSGVTTNGLISAINISAGTGSSNVTQVKFSDTNQLSWFWDGTFIQAQWAMKISAGTTARDLNQVTFTNANNISFGYFGTVVGNSSKISASYELDVSAGTATSGVNQISFADSNGIFWGLNGATITANPGYLSYFENQHWLVATGTQTVGNSTEFVTPFILPLAGSFSHIRIPVTMSSNSTTLASSASLTAFSGSLFSTYFAVVYSLGTGANSRSLQSVASGSGGFSEQLSMSVSSSRYTVSYKVTFPSEGASNSTMSASTTGSAATYSINQEGALSNFNGMRYLDIPFANSLSAGAYWLAYGVSSTTSTQFAAPLTGGSVSYSHWVATQPNQGFGLMGSATASSNAIQLGQGSYTTNAMTTGSIAMSQLSSSASHMHPYFQMIRQA